MVESMRKALYKNLYGLSNLTGLPVRLLYRRVLISYIDEYVLEYVFSWNLSFKGKKKPKTLEGMVKLLRVKLGLTESEFLYRAYRWGVAGFKYFWQDLEFGFKLSKNSRYSLSDGYIQWSENFSGEVILIREVSMYWLIPIDGNLCRLGVGLLPRELK